MATYQILESQGSNSALATAEDQRAAVCGVARNPFYFSEKNRTASSFESKMYSPTFHGSLREVNAGTAKNDRRKERRVNKSRLKVGYKQLSSVALRVFQEFTLSALMSATPMAAAGRNLRAEGTSGPPWRSLADIALRSVLAVCPGFSQKPFAIF